MDIWLQTGISSYDLGVNWLGLVVSLRLTTGLVLSIFEFTLPRKPNPQSFHVSPLEMGAAAAAPSAPAPRSWK